MFLCCVVCVCVYDHVCGLCVCPFVLCSVCVLPCVCICYPVCVCICCVCVCVCVCVLSNQQHVSYDIPILLQEFVIVYIWELPERFVICFYRDVCPLWKHKS